eukprot:jgi/Mesvir1/9718/Mv12189-RA.1
MAAVDTPVKSSNGRRAMEERCLTPRNTSKTPGATRKTPGGGDRFIPSRRGMDLDVARFNLTTENAKENSESATGAGNMSNNPQANNANIREIISPSKEEYKRQLAERLLDSKDGADSSKILAFKAKAPPPPDSFDNPMRELYSQNAAAGAKACRKAFRHIPQTPERILDAPELIDDYYLNLLDWSRDNVVAVALGTTVYLWNASSGTIEQLLQTNHDEDYVTSVAWAADGQHISVGTNSAEVQIWDASRLKQVRSLKGHQARVGSLAWNASVLSSGSRDNSIMNHDVRVREHVTAVLRAHEQEVCGLKWSPSGQQLASGGNDNMLHIWDAASISNGTYLHRLAGHQAAVKALAWCPFQSNLIASGGGTADRCIKFWNTHTGACLNSIDTHSQVCALQWSRHERELLSSHGFSQNQLCLWKYPSMVKMAELSGHTARVLHMASSPDGSTVVSAAADETLRFWKVFGDPAAAKGVAAKAKEAVGSSILRSINIR